VPHPQNCLLICRLLVCRLWRLVWSRLLLDERDRPLQLLAEQGGIVEGGEHKAGVELQQHASELSDERRLLAGDTPACDEWVEALAE